MKPVTLLLYILVFSSCIKRIEKKEIGLNNVFYDSAYHYLDRKIVDSAYLNFNRAKEFFLENNDSLNTANCLINMAILQKDEGDYFGAQETALQALGYLDKSDPDHVEYLSTNYNNLGATTSKLDDQKQAISFYNLAIKYSTNPFNILVFKNNIAVVYQDLKEYDISLKIFNEIIDSSKTYPKEYARILSNFARTKWLANPNYNPVPELLTSLDLRTKNNDKWGMNASFSHLSDYYRRFKPDSAYFYALHMFSVAEEIHSDADKRKALGKLVELAPIPLTKQYFEKYKLLDDTIQKRYSAAKNQFALIRYEVEKNKADNLRLQKDNAEHASRLVRQRAATGAVAIILFGVVIGGRSYYKKRRQRLEWEAQNKIKASQLKTSQKVHDVVANGIYRVMTEIEHRKDLDRGGILDQLEDMYLKSRDISYEAEEGASATKPYTEQIADLLKSFANEKHKILIVGNEVECWEVVNGSAKEEILHILQELMVNMKKHSQADSVVLRFEQDEKYLYLKYTDNGIGMPKNSMHGNGLLNTGNRIAGLGGEIIFAGEQGSGLKITITFPIS